MAIAWATVVGSAERTPEGGLPTIAERRWAICGEQPHG